MFGETIAILAIFAVIVILAMVLLGSIEQIQNRRREAKRPLANRIETIREDAAFQIEQFGGHLEHDPPPEVEAWLKSTIDYYRRLEALAADPTASAEDAEQLASESAEFVRSTRLKGVFVAGEAKRLAELFRKRDAVGS